MEEKKPYSEGLMRRIEIGRRILEERKRQIAIAKKWKFDTIAVHGLYSVEEAIKNNQGSIIEPIYMTTAQAYQDADEMEAALAYLIPTWCYTRIANPTVYYLEWLMALLEGYGFEGETSCVACSSGMSAIMCAVDPFLVKRKKGGYEPMNFVSTCQVYGGTFQQFSVRKMEERDIEVRWVVHPWEIKEWEEKIDKNTRFLYGELPSNPGQSFFDIKLVADLAHSHNIPLIVDSTCATPALLRPLLYGADIVVHSSTKSLTSSGFGVSGLLISRKDIITNIDNPKMKENFAEYVKFLPYRDNGPCISPFNAYLTIADIRTLRSKMDLFSRNAQKVAEFLEAHPKVAKVDYLGLPSYHLHELAKKYMFLVDSELDYGKPVNRYGHLMAVHIKGSAEDTRKFFDNLQRIWRATDLGRVKSVATIPAISTHQQQGEQARAMAQIPPQMVRLCIGGENPIDIIEDLDQALSKI